LKRVGGREVTSLLKRRISVRSAALVTLAAAAASFAAPHFAHSTLGEVAAEIADAPATFATATFRFVSNDDESHLGFDTNIYPGNKAMDAWRRSGEYEWVGYYLEAPCHKDDSWSGKRARLARTGWGLAVVYVGQQTWGRRLDPPKNARRARMPRATPGATCSAAFVTPERGRRDAADAIAKTAREGFARGSVIFLDLEYMDRVPQRMREYYRAWTYAVLADGRYRPGVYVHTHNAKTVYADLRRVFDAAGVRTDPPFWIAGSRAFDIDKAPTEVGHTFADVWQGMLDVVRTHNGVKLPIDISVAAAASPSASID
jgi:hypothetical protein